MSELIEDLREPKELNAEELRQRIAWQKGQLFEIKYIIKVLEEQLKNNKEMENE